MSGRVRDAPISGSGDSAMDGAVSGGGGSGTGYAVAPAPTFEPTSLPLLAGLPPG